MNTCRLSFALVVTCALGCQSSESESSEATSRAVDEAAPTPAVAALGPNLIGRSAPDTVPTAITGAATEVGRLHARLGVTVPDAGTGQLSECGVCWGPLGSGANFISSQALGPGGVRCMRQIPCRNAAYFTNDGFMDQREYSRGVTYEYKGYAISSVGTAYGAKKYFTVPSLRNNLIGSFNSTTATWRIKVQRPGTVEDVALSAEFVWGSPGDKPLVGDWDGDGIQTQGVWRNGNWYLGNTLGGGSVDISFSYGDPNHQPIVGDWNGDGIATPGVFINGVFYLRNSNTTGVGDISFAFGAAGDIPVVGDWDGDGVDTVGVYRMSNYTFYLANRNEARAPDITYAYGGDPSDQPIVGDWNGSGLPSPGIKRGAVWHLRNGFGSNPMFYDTLGGASDIPVTGNWKETSVENQRYLGRENWTSTPFWGDRGTFFVDMNGDGKDDAAALTSTGVVVRCSNGLSLGSEEQWSTYACAATNTCMIGDVTGDKKADLITFTASSVELRISNGSGFLAPVTVSTTPFYSATGTYLADIDGVNGLDLIVVDSTSVKSRKFVPCATGTCLDPVVTLMPSTLSFDYLGFADVTGDGKADAVGIFSTGATKIRRGTGFSLSATPELWGTQALRSHDSVTTKKVILRDITGDGVADLVVVNSNEVFMRRSNRFSFGSNESIAVQPSVGTVTQVAELTGDGRGEIVEASSSDGLKVTRSPRHTIGLRFIQPTADGNPRVSLEKIDQEIGWTNRAYAAADIQFVRVGNHSVQWAVPPNDSGASLAPVSVLETLKKQFNPDCNVSDLGNAGPADKLIYPSGTGNWQSAAFATRCALPNEIIVIIANNNNGFVPWDASAVLISAGSFWADWDLGHELGHFFGLGHAFDSRSPYEWDLVYHSTGPGVVLGYLLRELAFGSTDVKTPISAWHTTAHWCYPGQTGCPSQPAGKYTLVLPVADSSGAMVNTYTGSDILKGTSWRLPDGTPTYNIMGYAYNYVAGAAVPALSDSQVQLIRRYLTYDMPTKIRTPDGRFIFAGRPRLGDARQ